MELGGADLARRVPLQGSCHPEGPAEPDRGGAGPYGAAACATSGGSVDAILARR